MQTDRGKDKWNPHVRVEKLDQHFIAVLFKVTCSLPHKS
jgi:hypothetical protein